MWRLRPVVFENFKLDGGAMFGVVPKNLWSRLIAPDEQNRIQMVTRCLLLENQGRKILIDCGLGDKWDQKGLQIYDIKHLDPKINPSEITDVLITHFHFDHAGGLTCYKDGSLVPRFPKARVWASRRNVEECLNPNIRERASYLRENIEPVLNNLTQIEREGELFPGINCYFSNGHTAGLCWFEIQTDQGTVIYPSDVMPTSNHIKLAYNMGYDMCVKELLKEKQLLLDRIKQTQATVYFEHDFYTEKLCWTEF